MPQHTEVASRKNASRSRAGRSAAAPAAATSTIRLPAELGIEQAAALKLQLAAQLEVQAPVELDAREVQRIHTAALQLFCLFCRDRRSAGRAVLWQQPSAVLRSAAALLGMTTLLQLARDTP